MKKIGTMILALCLLAACAAPSPGEETPPAGTAPPTITPSPAPTPVPTPPPLLSLEDYPRVDGSTATIPLAAALMAGACAMPLEEAEPYIDHSGTGQAYINLLYGDADLLIAYEPSEEIWEMIRASEVELLMTPIGADALVFLVNESNPVRSLGGLQIVEIYRGRIANWKEVGGQDAPIAAFQRDRNSGSQAFMEALCMQGKPMMEPATERVIGEMGELIDRVASYDNGGNALGYSVYYYAQNMSDQPQVKLVAVDGVPPNNQTIASGLYPYVGNFYAVMRAEEPEGSPARMLYDFLLSPQGKTLIEQAGYVAK